MQQAFPSQRATSARIPPRFFGTSAGLVAIAAASTLLAVALHPRSLVAGGASLVPSMSQVAELVGGRPALQAQERAAATQAPLPTPGLTPSPQARAVAAADPTKRPLAAATGGEGVVVAPTQTPIEAGPPPAVDVATLPKPKGPPIAFFVSGRWVKNHRESALYASPDPRATTFTTLPQWNALLVIETRQDWLKVYFLGDYDGRQPGEAWIPLADTGAVDRPVVWARALGAGAVWASGEEQAAQRATLSAGALLELTGTVQGNRVQVRFPGDGQALQPGSGWVDAPVVQPILAPPPTGIPWSYPYTLQDGVLRIPTPYRSQIDGSPWAAANCGPTVVSMALAAFGVNVSSATLRAEVQDVQKEWGDDNGSYVWALADSVHLHGLKATGLYEGQPQEDHNGPWHQWTAEEIRTRLRAGHLVVPQVWWRGLPGREESDYYGDHYIVITGMLGDAFLYNDPVDRDGVGYDRVIRAEQLMAAMQASVAPGAAFAVSR